jgi:hypothetical protein
MIASSRKQFLHLACLISLVVCFGASVSPAYAAATIVIVNGDPANVGFNDPTAVAPVGGNPGTTLGQQRLNVFQAAASIWGAKLTSVPTIRVLSTMEPLTCTATGAVLGSAGATEVFRDFAGAPIPASWYPLSLANKLFGSSLDPSTAEIRARFNVNLGQPGCLTGIPFYLGLDNNHGNQVDMLTVLLHELSHGLGFQTFTSGITGAVLAGFPAAFDHFLLDGSTNKLWKDMTNSERAASALNTRHLAWNGSNVSASTPGVLRFGVPFLNVAGPAGVAGSYEVGTASFGPPLFSPGISGVPILAVPALACNPLSNSASVYGKVAIVDRGVCAFAVKVKNAQNAGAIGVVVVNSAAGSPPEGMSGADPTITIPSVLVTQNDGNTLKNALIFGSRTRPAMLYTLFLDNSRLLGGDSQGRMLMFTPNPFQSGSSVSHWDTIAFPNQLMEPAINGDLTHSVDVPQDLTLKLLKDLGWTP